MPLRERPMRRAGERVAVGGANPSWALSSVLINQGDGRFIAGGPIDAGENGADLSQCPIASTTYGAVSYRLHAACMTQLRAFSRRLGIPVGEFTVNTRCHWEAQQHGTGPYESRPIAFTLDIDLGEDASVADRRRLIEAAAKGCFIEQALKPGIVKHRLKAGGDWIDA